MIEVFIDFFVFIEGLKGNLEVVKILNYFVDGGVVVIINDIVVSEFLFYYICLKFGVLLFIVKSFGKILEFIKEDELFDFIIQFYIFLMDEEILFQVYNFMRRYNLFLNDVIILVVCKVNNIEWFVILDGDLIKVVREEGLEFL